MRSLEMFKMKKENLSSIYGCSKVQTTCKDEESGNLKIHTEDGFHDSDGDGMRSCDETGYINQTYVNPC